ncbi:MAG: hypothetical protein M0R40_04105 [Firmicutes bacterium]|nr:hypothetical protein [Bacillota bacterium]
MSDSSNFKKQENTDKTFFPSSTIILDICRNEYEREFNRTSLVDTKVSIFLTLSAALLAFITSLLDYQDIWNLVPSMFNNVVGTAYILLSFVSAALIVTSTIIFAIILYSRQYKNINLSSISKDELMKKNEDIINVALIRLYNEAVDYNRNINEKRMGLYKKGVFIAIVAVITSVLCLIIKTNTF